MKIQYNIFMVTLMDILIIYKGVYNMIITNTPKLTTDNLVLERFNLNDAKAMFEGWANSEAVTEWTLLNIGKTLRECEDCIRTTIENYEMAEDYHYWAIRYKEECIGSIALAIDIEHNCGEVAYVLAEKYWGNGYATEAVKKVLSFGFEELNLNRIEADFFAENLASERVLQKAGLIKEGTFRQRYIKFDTYHDAVLYAALKSEPYT
jgi:ribosomal-protein-alanine N-acetyltransferase